MVLGIETVFVATHGGQWGEARPYWYRRILEESKLFTVRWEGADENELATPRKGNGERRD